MDKIIRIQHKETELGVYHSRWSDKVKPSFSIEMSNFPASPRHPEPQDDSLLVKGIFSKYKEDSFTPLPFLRYGFSSKEQLRNWFYTDEIIREMDESGFEIVEMTGDVTHGHTQAVIDGRTVEKKESFPILEYLEIN